MSDNNQPLLSGNVNQGQHVANAQASASLLAQKHNEVTRSREEKFEQYADRYYMGEAKRDKVRQSRDRAQYVRQQKGHSLILHLTLGAVVLWIPAIYYTFSPNHYWHA